MDSKTLHMSYLPQNFQNDNVEMHLTACTAVLDVAINYDGTYMSIQTNERYYITFKYIMILVGR